MQKRISIASTGRLVTTCLLASMVATSCSVRPKTGTATTSTEGTSDIATVVNPADPGPYKTVMVGDAEMKQGRFPVGKFGGTLVLPQVASDPKTFNPWVANDTGSAQLGGLMFSGLLTMDPYTGKMIPDMAESIEVLPDHVTYNVRLRKGLKWSDGKPITADDVAFTYNDLVGKGYGNSSQRDVMMVEGKFPQVTVVDPLTVKFVTAKPFAPFIRVLSEPIAPKHVMEPVISKKDGRKQFDQLWSQSDNDASKTLVTSGPFVLSRFVPSQRVELKRTKNYYMVNSEGKQLPYLDRLVYLFVPDVNTILLKFKAKETDVSGIRNKDAVDLAKNAQTYDAKLSNLGPSTGTTFLMFNMNQRKNDKGKAYVKPYKSAWFNDVNFRQAVNHAVNRQQIVDGYLRGIGQPAAGSESSISPFVNADIKPIAQDLATAEKLLSQSGFAKGPDGKLYDKDHHLVEFDLLAPAGSTFYESMGGYIVNDLKKLGMKVNFQGVEFNVLGDKVSSSKDWETALFSLAGDPLDPNSGANVWKSNGRLHVFDQRDADSNGTVVVSDARPWEKEIDDAFDKGAIEFDESKRKEIYNRYQQIVYDQAPLVYLVSPMTMIVSRNTVGNFQPTVLSQTAQGLHNMDELYKTGGK